jgi:O-antigen ligase
MKTPKDQAATTPGNGPLPGGLNPFAVLILLQAAPVPVVVLPGLLTNVFNTPKTLCMLLGATAMAGIYITRVLRGRPVLFSEAATPKIVLMLVFLNAFSLFYTRNPYYTNVAATLNITSLSIFYFASLYIDTKRASWLLGVMAFSGLLVAIETWLQFFNIFILYKGVRPGAMIMGTVGNSNYLGAYLIFPLFAMVGLMLLCKGQWRIILLGPLLFMLGAMVFTRARASWVGLFFSLPLFLILLKKIGGTSIAALVKSNPAKAGVYALVVLVLLVCFWYATPKRFHDMVRFRNVTQSETLRLRLTRYFPASLWLFKQSPVFGTGLWSYRNLVYEAQAEIQKRNPGFFKNYPEPKPRRVHNEYLEVLNDGGLIAGAVLLLFFITVMRHGWAVIAEEGLDSAVRTVAATAFSAVVAVMVTALFFFPFRINTTLFMTALMMGVLEALYLRSYDRLKNTSHGIESRGLLWVPALLAVILIGLVWFAGVRPFLGELAHFQYETALDQGRPQKAERFLLKALDRDPHNTAYCVFASQFYKKCIERQGKGPRFC